MHLSNTSIRRRPAARGKRLRPALVLAAAVLAAGAVAPVSAGARAHSARGLLRAEHTGGAQDSRALALNWYDITNHTISAAAFPEPVTGSRTWSVSWLAAARAVGHSRDPQYSTAAFAQALHDTLAAIVPSQAAALDADLAATLATVPDGAAKSAGIAAGSAQAAAVLAQRAGDGLDTASVDTPFTLPAPGPGVWQATWSSPLLPVRAGEGNARPFLLSSANQFDPGPPPALDSQTYQQALDETRAYGAAASAVRTAAQTDTAKFWEPAANIQYVQLVRGALADVPAPLWLEARFVAVFQVITTDAQIAIYNAKYEYLFWRPLTAIQQDATAPDPTWTPFFTTPRHPEYPSGHGGYAGAAQVVLTAFLGPNTPAPIDVTSPTDPGSVHTYTDWATATREVLDARVWEGIHFRFSDNTGARVGAEVALYDLLHIHSLGL